MTAPQPVPPEAAEPDDPEQAVAYWRELWAHKADQLAGAVGVIHDLCSHANPIGHDEDDFSAVGYTVTIGAVHRALAWLQGASALQDGTPDKITTWAEYESWLARHWPGMSGS